MKTIKGDFGQAKIFTDTLEESAEAQIKSLCNMEYTKDCKIRIMPDVHAGAGCTIGTTMKITDKIVPNLVGVDIGCGMETIILKNNHIEFEKLDKVIRENIPSAMNIREEPHQFAEETNIDELICFKDINSNRAYRSIGTLGGGNHFIEVDKDDDGNLYLVIHSGSRHLGKEVATFYQEQAARQLKKADIYSLKDVIAKLKEEGREKEIEETIEKIKKDKAASDIPYALAYVEGQLFKDYIHDMKIVQRFAEINRKAMADTILRKMKLKKTDEFTTIHNYIDTDNMILRKGAVSAQKGEKLLIPINMRDGSLVCIGKGNEDWNCSAPHGAGRLMSRAVAKNSFTVSQFKKEMSGIFTTSVSSGTLDECPMAYKNMDEIVNNIVPTANIEKIIKPVYNFKADEDIDKFGKRA